jgi:hypothetical protein
MIVYYTMVLGLPALLVYESEQVRCRSHKKAARAAAGAVAMVGTLLLAEALVNWLRGY